MRALLTSVVVAALTSLAWAESQVRVTTDRAIVEQGKTFRITVEASGEDVGEPVIPTVPGLSIAAEPIYAGSNRTLSYISGKLTVSITKTRGYNAVAQELGEIEIPAIGVSVGGELVYGQPVKITVVRAGASRAQPSPTRSDKSLSVDDALFLTVDTSNNDVYQGEAIDATFTLWALFGSTVRQYESVFPSSTGFYAVPREPEKPDKEELVRNNLRYQAIRWRQTLYPTQTGVLELGPWKWQGLLVAPHAMEAIPVELATDPVRIAVAPLPQPPQNFSGAVGKFEVSVTRERDDALQGVPTNMTVSISGRGNPDAIPAPKFPEVDWAYIGDPQKISGPVDPADRAHAELEFEYQVTPIQAGSHVLPSIDFCYFDPELEEYVTANSEPLPWKVLPSAEADRQILVDESSRDTRSVAMAQRDISPVVTDPGPITRRGSRVVFVTMASILPALGYGAFAAFVQRKRRFASDGRYARAYHALSRAQKRLATIDTNADPVDGLYKAITGFVADSYNVPEAGLTSADAERLLRERSADPELAGGFTKILRACERARYGTGTLSADEVHALVHGALASMERLDALRARGDAS
ncbi:MAG: BatD family protein [Candidatus Hydrogenedentes bacterium]|nr:BatD family protein [Candidatus Hydrogenedentota bacterium]